MRDFDRSNKNLEQDTIDKHLKRALRELLQVSRVINGLGITRKEKRALEKELTPLLSMVKRAKLRVPTPVEEEVKVNKKNKEVKDVNRRRKESK